MELLPGRICCLVLCTLLDSASILTMKGELSVPYLREAARSKLDAPGSLDGLIGIDTVAISNKLAIQITSFQ